MISLNIYLLCEPFHVTEREKNPKQTKHPYRTFQQDQFTIVVKSVTSVGSVKMTLRAHSPLPFMLGSCNHTLPAPLRGRAGLGYCTSPCVFPHLPAPLETGPLEKTPQTGNRPFAGGGLLEL